MKTKITWIPKKILKTSDNVKVFYSGVGSTVPDLKKWGDYNMDIRKYVQSCLCNLQDQ